ncbi:response regulator [Paenibacillus sp. HWE-109]|uniref:response regulator n=1 Tax=Paenibacillus sp. HWE-109 TaxID=1306526 RepID=UPI001EDE75FC|nr:response regulator [Paenibacillus sp. HWE-109]UKS26001.1 response regulator [Paenibacillus sp. HWE-109]
MIKVMAVDDELPALKMAESVLRTFDDVDICGLFQDPEELLERVPAAEPDLVLVDMKMPGMNGLELAGRIQECNAGVSIAFVTAYDHYAVAAFQAEALDYVLKPVTAERLRQTLDRIARRRRVEPLGLDLKQKMSVRSFIRFSVEAPDGKELKFRRAKTEELLAFLLHHGNQPVAKEKIMDALWGDRDADRARGMLYTTMYQLRKELEEFGLFEAIEQSRAAGGRCRLVRVPDLWDCSEFEKRCRRFKEDHHIEDAHRAVELYKGGYLVENGYEWAAEKREELELAYVELLNHITNDAVGQHRFDAALRHLERWAQLHPLTERIHVKIIALHLLMNNKDAAVAHERWLRNLFARELGVSHGIDMRTLALNPLAVFS